MLSFKYHPCLTVLHSVVSLRDDLGSMQTTTVKLETHFLSIVKSSGTR